MHGLEEVVVARLVRRRRAVPRHARVDVELGPVAEAGEEAEEDRRVVARRVVLDGLLAHDEPDEDEERARRAARDDLVERREQPAPEQDEVEHAVDRGVAAPRAERLVDRVADVDRRAANAMATALRWPWPRPPADGRCCMLRFKTAWISLSGVPQGSCVRGRTRDARWPWPC